MLNIFSVNLRKVIEHRLSKEQSSGIVNLKGFMTAENIWPEPNYIYTILGQLSQLCSVNYHLENI